VGHNSFNQVTLQQRKEFIRQQFVIIYIYHRAAIPYHSLKQMIYSKFDKEKHLEGDSIHYKQIRDHQQQQQVYKV
jgi:hypothetical protein